MRKDNLRVATLALLLVMLLAACSSRERGEITGADADPNNLPEIIGNYAVNGFDPTGTEYGGTLAVVAGDTAGTYTLQWIVTGNLASGTGIIEGNQLIVEWQSADDRQRPTQGTAVYTITTLGEMYGERSVDGYDEPGTELLFPNDADWGTTR